MRCIGGRADGARFDAEARPGSIVRVLVPEPARSEYPPASLSEFSTNVDVALYHVQMLSASGADAIWFLVPIEKTRDQALREALT